MTDYQAITLFISEEDRDFIKLLKETYEERTNVAVFRAMIVRLKEAIGEDATKGTALRRSIKAAAEQAAEQQPFAKGRSTSLQFSTSQIEFLDRAAAALKIEGRTRLIRGVLRVAAKGQI